MLFKYHSVCLIAPEIIKLLFTLDDLLNASGNTPSQTEVKIISCIPIDVTDLQKKIIELEKQLEERTQRVCVSAVHTAIVNPSCTSKHSKAGNSSYLLLNPTCSTKQKDSINSLICFEEANPSDAYRYTSFSEITPTECCMPTKHRRKFLFNKKKVKRNKNLNTHIVYYMQPEGKTPFNNYSLTDYETFKNRRKNVNIFNRSYLSELVSKQYNHGALNKGRTVSEFSTPICRDFIPIQKGHEPQAYDTDICSCCRGRFQNIDNHISKQNHFGILLSDSTRVNTRNAYYDTNFYDVVPVKENSIKVKNLNVSKRKDSKTHVDISCWPENVHLRYRAPPTLAPLRQHITRKVPLISHIKKEKTLNNMAKKKPILCDPGSPKNNIQVLKTHSVEYSEVYAKRLKNSRVKISKLTPTKVNKFKDAACSNIVVVNTERQTTSDSNADSQDNKKNVALSPSFSEDKTDVTLNQIKSILQSVLTVVKTQTKISKISEQVKKDAVVQETPTNNFCYPNILPESVKGGMQLYPLFIQQQRNMYDSCYGNNNIKLTNMKSAVSAATNTEELQVRSQETEHLIKEIYKSMALNIESIERMAGCKYMVPTKDTSVKEHGDINETIQNYNNSPEDTETKHIAKALSEIFQTTNSLCTSVTLNNDTPLKSNLGSNKKSFRSQLVRNCRQSSRKERVDCYSNHVYSEGGDNDETEQGSELESNDDRDDTIVDDKTGPPISETESDEVIPFKVE